MTDNRTPKFPDAIVDTNGLNGNAFSIMGAARRAMRSVGATQADLDAYAKAAMSGNYDNLLRVTMEWVTME